MAAVVSEADGDEGIGGAFHVGEGVFVTARHVVEGRKIKEVRVTDPDLFYQSSLYPKNENGSYTISSESPRMCVEPDGRLTIVAGPFLHPDPLVDVAGFKATGMHESAHYVPLGDHLDDWVGRSAFVLSRALVMGYPPVPLTREPILIAATCEVSANVDIYTGQTSQLHFILSAMPRGGFSGGLVVTENGLALGVISKSLVKNQAAEELGFFATTSIEAIYVCLQKGGILPACQSDDWDGLWEGEPK